MKKNIAVVAGGNSGEHDISMHSGYNIADKLDKSLFNVYFIHLKGKDWNYVSPNKEIYPIDKNDFSLKLKIIVFVLIVFLLPFTVIPAKMENCKAISIC